MDYRGLKFTDEQYESPEFRRLYMKDRKWQTQILMFGKWSKLHEPSTLAVAKDQKKWIVHMLNGKNIPPIRIIRLNKN